MLGGYVKLIEKKLLVSRLSKRPMFRLPKQLVFRLSKWYVFNISEIVVGINLKRSKNVEEVSNSIKMH